MTITDELLKEIENAADKTYPGPWFNSYGDIMADYISGGEDEPAVYATEIGQIVSSPGDAIFIALARTAVPEMLNEIKRLHDEIQALETANKILTLNLDAMP